MVLRILFGYRPDILPCLIYEYRIIVIRVRVASLLKFSYLGIVDVTQVSPGVGVIFTAHSFGGTRNLILYSLTNEIKHRLDLLGLEMSILEG